MIKKQSSHHLKELSNDRFYNKGSRPGGSGGLAGGKGLHGLA